MRKTVACKLQPDKEQAAALSQTLIAYAEACNAVLEVANASGKKNKFALQRECYAAIKQQTGLTANYVIRAIARVSQSFGRKRRPKEFRPTSLDLDKDLIRFIPANETVSLATLAGRQKIKLRLGNYQRHLLKGQKPTAGHLAYDRKRNNFHLHFIIDIPEPPPTPTSGTLGVDLGINRIATLSTGEIVSGRDLKRLREVRQRTRSSLQAKGTEGAKCALKRLSGRQARMMRDVNHCLSKQIVGVAKEKHLEIALEDLTGIRDRCAQKGRRMRRMLGGWAFYQLRTFIEYKAQQAGVGVVTVSPRKTSKTCSACGQIGSRRKHRFSCVSCGCIADADHNAAINIARAGAAKVSSRIQSTSPKPEPSLPASRLL
jgi:IS605 OrfB family transposase